MSGIFIGYHLDTGGAWSGDLLILDWHQLDTVGHVNDVHPRRIRYKEVETCMLNGFFRFPLAENALNQPGPKDKLPRTRPQRTASRPSGEPSPAPALDTEDTKAQVNEDGHLIVPTTTQPDEWHIIGDALVRTHHNPRVTLYVPTSEECPIPLKYLHIFRCTNTDLSSRKEHVISDHYTDGRREL